MTVIISHRGNINGKDIENENKPEQILKAIDLGYYVEVDIWIIDNDIYLGHDHPQYKVDRGFIEKIKNKTFFHCKNHKVMYYLNKDINFFIHDKDAFSITNNGEMITGDLNLLTSDTIHNTIYLSPELYGKKFSNLNINLLQQLYGICTDYPELVEKYMEENE